MPLSSSPGAGGGKGTTTEASIFEGTAEDDLPTLMFLATFAAVGGYVGGESTEYAAGTTWVFDSDDSESDSGVPVSTKKGVTKDDGVTDDLDMMHEFGTGERFTTLGSECGYERSEVRSVVKKKEAY